MAEAETFQLGGFDSHGTTRARYRGRAIEVEHGIPGETVRAEILGQKRPRGRIVEVLDPDPDRVEPPCPYFRDWACGGCQWQQIAYEGQVRRKVKAVEETMRAAALLFSVTAVHTLDDPWRYRSTAGIALGKSAGFRRHGSLAIVPIRDCPISHPAIGRLLAALNDRICAGALPDFRGRTRLDVRLTGEWDDAKLQVLIRPDAETRLPPDALSALLAALREREEVAGIALARSDGSIETLWGELLAPTWVAGQPVWLAAASFFQTNLRLLPDLIARLKAESSPLDGKSIVDVYAGVGLFGLFLAGAAREVIAIESDALAVEAGKRTAGEWGLTNIRFVPRPAEEALTGGKSFDVVIVDPPRSGLTPGVIEALLAGRPPLLLYVSCLPQSLARDLQTLTRTYRLEHLELFDFYPQTYHVELLAVLRPELGKTSATA